MTREETIILGKARGGRNGKLELAGIGCLEKSFLTGPGLGAAGELNFMRQHFQEYGFIVAIFLVAGGALIWPEPGVLGGWFRPEVTTSLVVMGLFFLQGLHLPTRALLDGWRSGPYLGVSLLFMFMFTPVLAILLLLVSGIPLGWERDLIWGVLFLAILPTTVATSTIYTDLAGGDRVAALYNAGISNLLGLLYIPFVWVIFFPGEGVMAPPWHLLGGIASQLLLPFALGQVIRHTIRPWLETLRPWSRRISHAGVLFIFYVALAGAMASGQLGNLDGGTLVTFGGFILVFYALLQFICLRTVRQGWFTPGQRVGLQFTWPQKSVALGVPLAQVMFPSYPGLGVILLPILVYHPLQLIHGALLANQMRRRNGGSGG